MKVWKDREGKKITASEFMSRWKDGIAKVTPLQQIKSQLMGYVLVALGIIIGLITTFMMKQWWLFIILLGSAVISGTQALSTMQRFIILDKLEKEAMNDTLAGEVENEIIK